MASASEGRALQARRSIIGFGCNQGFLLGLLYLGLIDAPGPDVAAPRLGLVVVLLAMMAALLLSASVGARPFVRRVEDALVATRGVPLTLFSLAVAMFAQLEALPWEGLAVLQGVLVGMPAALLLTAWGRALGQAPIEQSVPEVFIGSAVGAAACLIAASLPVVGSDLVVALLPLGSAVGLHALLPSPDAASPGDAQGDDAPRGHDAAPVAEDGADLAGRILGGTAVYGAAAGAVEALAVRAGADGVTSIVLTLVLLVLYCAAALQLYGGSPLAGVRAILPQPEGPDAGPLDGAYRLAVLLMVSGLLFMPLLAGLGVPSESVMLAGYLGVLAVLVSLFLVMGRLSGRDASRAFARGLAALFAGELAGLGAGALVAASPLGPLAAPAVAALGGIAALYAYLFLFTDRDLRELSVAVERTDRFEEACRAIAEQAGLSRREAEILPLALRGRTSERMAAELFISKNTVDTHMRRIYAKCGVRNRQELIDLGERAERDAAGR